MKKIQTQKPLIWERERESCDIWRHCDNYLDSFCLFVENKT